MGRRPLEGAACETCYRQAQITQNLVHEHTCISRPVQRKAKLFRQNIMMCMLFRDMGAVKLQGSTI